MYPFKNPRASALALVALTLILAGRASGQTGPTATAKGNLLVLPVGVSQLEQPGNDLQWADQDAIDQAAFWKAQQGSVFGKVYCHEPLLNRNATRENILQAMQEITGRTGAGDTVVAVFSGHGGVSQQLQQYVFCATNGCLSASEIRSWVVNLTQKGARVFLILDTCHAAAINLQVEGVVVLASCSASESSSDGDPFALHNNGLFTRVLLEALRGQADRNGDGIITLGEVMAYVSQRVPELCQADNQHPQVFCPASTPTTLSLAGVSGATVTLPALLPGTGSSH